MLKSISMLIVLLISTLCFAEEPGFRVVKEMQLGGDGGWDLMAIDTDAERLYISRSTHVMVVDLKNEKVVGEIPETSGVHGIAVARELNRGYTSNGKTNTSTIFDLKTLRVVGEVKTGANPDAILYDPVSQRVFTFNGQSQDATVFDAVSLKSVATLKLGGKPELAVADGNGKIFVNIEDTGEVVEIDSQQLVLTKRFSLKPCEEPTGIGFDPAHQRIYSGCHNKIMTILDVKSGKLIGTVPIGGGVDGNEFDPSTGMDFSSNGEGTLTVVREDTPGKFRVFEEVNTQRGARTMILDPKTHRIYLPAATFLPPPASAPEGPKNRPVMVKDSFVLLVVEK